MSLCPGRLEARQAHRGRQVFLRIDFGKWPIVAATLRVEWHQESRELGSSVCPITGAGSTAHRRFAQRHGLFQQQACSSAAHGSDSLPMQTIFHASIMLVAATPPRGACCPSVQVPLLRHFTGCAHSCSYDGSRGAMIPGELDADEHVSEEPHSLQLEIETHSCLLAAPLPTCRY